MALTVENSHQIDVDDPNFSSIFTPELHKLSDIFKRHNVELRIAGGAVRDFLLGKQPHDVDFATPATPDEMQEIFMKEGIRMIHDKGTSHGTVTVRVNDAENFEITTLRIDMVTDGRHAQVQYTRDWQIDANRRDLTVNAMFLTLDGLLIDYFGGEKDLHNRRVTFVGNASERIREDYLRILRYFRFYGRLAVEPEAHEKETLDAIGSNREGLQQLSGERVWDELKKILIGNHAGAIFEVMHQLDLLPFCGLPKDISSEDVARFSSTCSRTSGLDPLPVTLMADFVKTDGAVKDLLGRLKISRAEKNLATFLVHHKDIGIINSKLKTFQDLTIDEHKKDPMVKHHVLELLKYRGDRDLLLGFQDWTPAKLPVTGFDLIKAGVEKGKKINLVLEQLTEKWKQSGFTMTTDDLLNCIVEGDVK